MTGLERGFLLLCSHLGIPARKALTTAQFRTLASRVQHSHPDREDGKIAVSDLMALGYDPDMAGRIISLLKETGLLEDYLRRAAMCGCVPVTRASEGYPESVRRKLGQDAPGCFWAKGDLSLLNTPAVSVVGSRELGPENRKFAEMVGLLAAQHGYTLVSGNARGADQTAQEACLAAGGRVISIVADELQRQAPRKNVLYLSEDDFDARFSSKRALSRNRSIHAMGQMVFVAQSALGKGGTWDGTTKNLRYGWSPAACFRDGSEAVEKLQSLGASVIGTEELKTLFSEG